MKFNVRRHLKQREGIFDQLIAFPRLLRRLKASPTRGLVMLSIFWAYKLPMMANWTRNSGPAVGIGANITNHA